MKKSAKSGTGAGDAQGSGGTSLGGKSVGGLRHLFTARSARQGEPGGFQTVARSSTLRNVEAVEELVAGYQAPEAEAPPCRQLLPVPGRSSAYALTTFTPTGRTPDDRPGNYWAETVVVPASWLEQAGWDAAAAFAAIDWQGPRDLASLPEELPPVELPALAAGPLSRLEALPRAVPENLLYPLLLAAIQQSHGLLPVRLLEAPGAEPRLLEDVVSLLPLVVPPALRTYRDGGQRRCLTLRTRSPRGGMTPAADVTGFPAAAAAELEQERGGMVIDLGGTLPPPEVPDRFGQAYARWLTGVLREGRWEELEERYAEEITGPALGWLAGFRLDQAAARPPTPEAAGEEGAAEAEAAPSAYSLRMAGWKARDEAEAEAWGVLTEQRRQLEETLTGWKKELDDAVVQASERLKKYGEEQRGLVDEEVERALQASKTAAKKRAQGTARDRELEQRIEDLEEDLRRLNAQLRQLRDEPQGQGLAIEGVGSAEAARRRDGEEEAGGRPSAGLGGRLRSFLGSPKEPGPAGEGGIWRGIGWVGQWAAAAMILLLLVLLLLKGVGWLFPGGGQGSPGGTGGGTGAAADGSAEPSPPTPAQRRQALLERLQAGATAAALLREAAGREGFEGRAHALLLVHVLPTSAQLPDGAKIAFLQQALGITVDAGWGETSSATLRERLPEKCKACRANDSSWPQNDYKSNGRPANCFLNTYLDLADDSCKGESPWRTGRTWTEAEATAALALFRATRETLQASGRENRQALAGEIAKLDPADPEGAQLWADLRATRPLPADYAETLLGLAYSLVTDDPEAVGEPEELDDDLLGEIETLLDPAVAPETPESGGGGAG
jgi:hypothetical protein